MNECKIYNIKCTAVRPHAWSEALKKARVKVELCFGGVELFGNIIKIIQEINVISFFV